MTIDIKALLDICDITYTEKQLLILEKLVDDLLQQHIKEAINDFYDDGTTSNLDVKLGNEILIGTSNFYASSMLKITRFRNHRTLLQHHFIIIHREKF